MPEIRPILNRSAALFESVAALFLAATMLLTIADVCLRTIDTEWRIFGVIEMVQFTFDNLVFLAVPAVFLLQKNILVNLFDEFVGRKSMRFLVTLGSVVAIVYVALLLWQTVATGLEAVEFGDTTQDLRWPIVWYWIPIWIGFGFAIVAEVVHLLRRARSGADEIDWSDSGVE